MTPIVHEEDPPPPILVLKSTLTRCVDCSTNRSKSFVFHFPLKKGCHLLACVYTDFDVCSFRGSAVDPDNEHWLNVQ